MKLPRHRWHKQPYPARGTSMVAAIYRKLGVRNHRWNRMGYGATEFGFYMPSEFAFPDNAERKQRFGLEQWPAGY